MHLTSLGSSTYLEVGHSVTIKERITVGADVLRLAASHRASRSENVETDKLFAELT